MVASDLEGSRLHISESLAEVAGQLHFGTTKTHRQRVIAIPAIIRDRLHDHLDETDIASDQAASSSRPRRDGPFVIRTSDNGCGRPQSNGPGSWVWKSMDCDTPQPH